MRLKHTPVMALSTLMASMLLAQSSNALAQSQWLPYNPTLQVSGTLSQEGIFNADGLVPLYGNWDGFVYGAVNARYSTDDTGLLAPGLGIRAVAHNTMYGAYVFADATRTQPKANFWVINPGIEWASPHWDVHMNGYIPTKRSKALDVADFYSNYGDYSHTSFQGHSQYDALGALSVAVGQGLDAEVGYSIPMRQYRSRVFLGGYYFSMPQQLKAVQGIAGGIQLPLNAYADLILTDSYDKLRRHEVGLSVRLTLGHKNTYSDDVHTRMLEGVERHVGMWSTGNGTVSQQALQATGQRALYKDNIWFFKPNAGTTAEPVSLQSCTFEHPCSQFDQQTIDAINQVSANANFYLTPGTYTIAPSANQAESEMFHLNQGQSVYGRSSDYHAAATDNERALLAGPVKALGNNVLDRVRIVNNGIVTKLNVEGEDEYMYIWGLYLPETTIGTVRLTQTDVQAIGAADIEAVGILTEAGHLFMQGGAVRAENFGIAVGIESTGDSQITANDIVITANDTYARGIVSYDESQIIVNDVVITVESNNRSAYGIASHDSSVITANDTVITAESKDGYAEGIMSHDSSVITANDTVITAESKDGYADGIVDMGNSLITLNDSRIQVETTGNGEAVGIRNMGGTIDAKNIQLDVLGFRDGAALVKGETDKLHFSGNNVCKLNGHTVPCP